MNMDIMVCCLITAAILSAELREAANMTVIHWAYMLEIKTKPGSITGFVSYGLQANKGTAYLPVLGQTAESGYDSKIVGVIGVEYAYDLDYGKPEELWHVSPYARLNFTHYRQKAFREHGAGVF